MSEALGTHLIDGSFADKTSALDFLRTDALKREVAAAESRGLKISYGDTEDRAYEHPEEIGYVHDRLYDGGRLFAEDIRATRLGSATVARFLELSPRSFGGLREYASRESEASRAARLYDQQDVRAMQWHKQAGSAVALLTINDAHDLSAHPEDGGVYPTMGARLGLDALEHQFSDSEWVTENIRGKKVADAMADVRGGTERAHQSRDKELRALQEFIVAPVEPGFKEIVQYCTDSLGIRSRQQEVRQVVNEHAERTDKEELLMMSVGCGTAQPILDVVRELRENGRKARMVLIDQNPASLAFAEYLAQQMGLEDAVEIHCMKLFNKKGGSLVPQIANLDSVIRGREFDVCEDSGLREYFPNSMYRDLSRQTWEALAPGGLMTTGNMNKNRPQPEFLHGLMGWHPQVRMRSIGDLARLHGQIGIPREASDFRVTQDGVYTMVRSVKPQK